MTANKKMKKLLDHIHLIIFNLIISSLFILKCKIIYCLTLQNNFRLFIKSFNTFFIIIQEGISITPNSLPLSPGFTKFIKNILMHKIGVTSFYKFILVFLSQYLFYILSWFSLRFFILSKYIVNSRNKQWVLKSRPNLQK